MDCELFEIGGVEVAGFDRHAEDPDSVGRGDRLIESGTADGVGSIGENDHVGLETSGITREQLGTADDAVVERGLSPGCDRVDPAGQRRLRTRAYRV